MLKKPVLLIAFAVMLLLAPATYAQTETPEYDPATIAILEELIAKNYAHSNEIKMPLDFKVVWSDTKPKQLLKLDLGYTHPRGEVVIHDLPYLEKLSFANTKNITLHNLPRLKTFIATKLNSISDIKGLATITSLENLEITNGKISKIEGLETLVNLQSLNLGENKIENIEGLENLSNLAHLELDINYINKIENLDSLLNLKYLSLWKNQIERIEGLDKLINLEILHLGKNPIIVLENIAHLINLNYFSARCSDVIDISGIYGLTQLQKLDLNQTRLIDISGIGVLIALETLDLSYNKALTKGVEDLEALVNLKKLNLEGSGLKGDVSYLKTLNRLENLNLNGYQISDFSVFEQLNALLSELSLNATSITQADLEYLFRNRFLQDNLVKLNLSHNDFKAMDFVPFSPLRRLNYLNLTYNNLTSVDGLAEFDKNRKGYRLLVDFRFNRLPLSEALEIYQFGMILSDQHDVYFDSMTVKARTPLPLSKFLPKEDLIIEGIETKVYYVTEERTRMIIPKDADGNYYQDTRTETGFCEWNKDFKVKNGQITFLRPGRFSITFTNASMLMAGGSNKGANQYVFVPTGIINVVK